MILIEDAIRLYMDAYTIYAPDQSEVCVVIDDKWICFTNAFTVNDVSYARSVSINMLVLDEGLEGQITHNGLNAGERMLLQFAAAQSGYRDVQELYSENLQIELYQYCSKRMMYRVSIGRQFRLRYMKDCVKVPLVDIIRKIEQHAPDG